MKLVGKLVLEFPDDDVCDTAQRADGRVSRLSEDADRDRILVALRLTSSDQKWATTQEVVFSRGRLWDNVSFGQPSSKQGEESHEAAFGLFEDARPGSRRHGRGSHPHERIHKVAAMTFLDEEGNPRQFTWRTIQTWYYRYKNHGITGMTNGSRSDKGKTRKITPEELLEAINAAKPHFHNKRYNKLALYRFCIEKGLLRPDQIAQTTFYRFIREYDLLANEEEENNNKKRLAFSMKYANQLWQADTMFGPYLATGVPSAAKKQARLIAFIDDASRVLCHGEFFFEENVDSLVANPACRLLQTRCSRTTSGRQRLDL